MSLTTNFPPWTPLAVSGTVVVVLVTASFLLPHPDWDKTIRVAFVGSSIQYYNDCPRLMEVLSDGHIIQNSCFRPAASTTRILQKGNGMYERYQNPNAIIDEDQGIYDFGACTVKQLLFGKDDEIEQFNYGDDDGDAGDDSNSGNELLIYDDGLNPCLQSETYRQYIQEQFDAQPTPQWDFVMMNDQTKGVPDSDFLSVQFETLEAYYIPCPTFSKLLIGGYMQYAELLAENLPSEQRPRLAPVAIAFLTVWEENRDFWPLLFADDCKHTSLHGTYFQGLIWYFTLFRRMPHKSTALRDDMSFFFERRRWPPQTDDWPAQLEVSREEAEYLYFVAERVCVHHHIPQALGEDSDYGTEWW
uniref:Uncharacterized protein n=1 Tax=Odontella aurita TaxID=265563 RepID=A0A7S4HKI5_9STRA|mmetsp:Transcript_11472/g.33822  ORF Transcript_11472/g.33822 Transcript_11472/m.33822 type:complete len:359 (+) Transcript_11472:205-1281(+)